jgi:hypothetical protein
VATRAGSATCVVDATVNEPKQAGTAPATTRPTTSKFAEPTTIKEKVAASSTERHHLDVVDPENRDEPNADKDKVIKLTAPKAIQEPILQEIGRIVKAVGNPFDRVSIEVMGTKDGALLSEAGLTQVTYKWSGPSLSKPIDASYKFSFHESVNEPIKGGQHLRGMIELTTSQASYTVDIDVMIRLQRSKNLNRLEPVDADVVWRGPKKQEGDSRSLEERRR